MTLKARKPTQDGALVDAACERLHDRLDETEASQVEEFTRQLYRWVPPEDLVRRSALDLDGAALALWRFAEHRPAETALVRVYNPEFEQHGWQTGHTAVEIVTDDMPFLVDSITMELTRLGYGVHLMIHPVIRVRRDESGELQEVLGPGSPMDGAQRDSVMQLEVDRQTEPAELDALRAGIARVLGEVRAAVTDWRPMRERMRALIADLAEPPAGVDPEDVEEARALLEWLEDDHFTFLGTRDYELTREAGEDRLRGVEGSGLGILRESDGRHPPSRAFARLPQRVRALARTRRVLVLTKANSRATVHRPAYLDYVGVKRFDAQGEVIGERRFLGLYTTAAYRTNPREIPLLRRKVRAVIDRAGFPPDSHDEKALLETLETYPRDELFEVPVEDLFDTAMGILALGERQRVRLFMRKDEYERFFSCLVFLPRDRFNTQNRERVAQILSHALDAESVDFSIRFSESVLVRAHFIVRITPGEVPEFDVEELETAIVEATRAWADDLREALLDECGEERGTGWYRRYGDAFPTAYRVDWVARSAVTDIRRIEGLEEAGGLALSLYRPLEAPPGALRCKLFRSETPVSLSHVLPMFENMGLRVVDERPYRIRPRDGRTVWLYDFGLTTTVGDLALDEVRRPFEEAFTRVWRGDAENDGLDALILRAGLDWRAVTVLRAIARYLRQAGSTFSDRYTEQVLVAHPRVARRLVELFHARFDPLRPRDEGAAEALGEEIEEAVDAIESLDADRILRSFLTVLRATVRTTHFQLDESGAPRPYLALKLDPSRIPLLPLPRPRFEVWVYSPRTEGVHLRGGPVARGGLRWSDRREDFRTEVLGLMKAQMVKNALIVPVGAKGGFVVKRPPEDREELRAEVVACYRAFISGLLDLTDNIVDGQVVPPADVVRYDGDDPYLVVAADKGTATFSDIANGIALEKGFWLGDAFASGGSAGYDHKGMGITARGAWESVKRHFRELGRDIGSEDTTVVGIGDMSGDVFGNGMLLSRHLKIVAAFDHRHIFIDPDPDPERSFAERERLFALPRSSWADYDASLISAGGGVWPRTAKSVAVSAEARAALGVEDERLTPNALVSAILRAPVDLLWNGGIGTYVKASFETHADVGDKANDGVRVDAPQLRCHVVGEGGNLGLTQRARIEFALGGGRIYTDAIDNSAGVDCSDHEVNIKVLLDSVVADGDLTEKQRNELLVEMTDAVAELVLRDNYSQTQALSVARVQAASMLEVHDRYLSSLEQAGRLNRPLEALPDFEAVAERRSAGLGLTQPELAVVLAYSKITLYAALLESDLPEDPFLSRDLARYFPAPLPERFPEAMERHRLRREIIATHVTNSLVDRVGVTFVFRLEEDTGASCADIARAYAVAREVFGLRRFWREVEALDGRVEAELQNAMLLEARRLVERATRWLLRTRRRPLDIAAAVERFEPGAEALVQALPGILADGDRDVWESRVNELGDADVPAGVARRAASLGALLSALAVVEVAHATGRSVDDVAAVHFALGARLHLHWLADRIAALSREDRWKSRARAALRDDVFSLHGELTAEVLRDCPEGDSVEPCLQDWMERNSGAVERCLGILTDIRSAGAYDLATLPVALREVRNLIQPAAVPV